MPQTGRLWVTCQGLGRAGAVPGLCQGRARATPARLSGSTVPLCLQIPAGNFPLHWNPGALPGSRHRDPSSSPGSPRDVTRRLQRETEG